ncbi:MAG: FHA domain-containing protein [Roseburia sp.]|nr:FHA domain-containing protein [Roseburia sp.]
MFETEYVRSLHCNYERFLLTQKPEEKRYQYCMLSRGGIRGLLSCSLRYVNGKAYLYYDITSRQNIAQLYQKGVIGREWLQDFMGSVRQIQWELGRFLLQENNILWEPEQIFQDLEKNEFSFIYIPYYEGENHFLKLLSFLVEHIDYEDEGLVECVYKMYEQLERNGEVYLQEKIFEDVKALESKAQPGNSYEMAATEESVAEIPDMSLGTEAMELKSVEASASETKQEKEKVFSGQGTKKSLLGLFDNKKGKAREREQRGSYREAMQQKLEGYAVAEDTVYEDSGFGQTVYLDAPREEREILHRLYSPDGRILARLESSALLLGKARDKVDLYLDDISVSRLHARLIRNQEEVSLEDLNSTNGTYLNGMQLQPYEKRKLEPGDEIRCGKIVLQYR